MDRTPTTSPDEDLWNLGRGYVMTEVTIYLTLVCILGEGPLQLSRPMVCMPLSVCVLFVYPLVLG